MAGRARWGSSRSRLDPGRVERLAWLAAHAEYERAVELLERLHQEGLGSDGLLLGVLAGAAQRLDAWWHEDRCSAFELTLGICQLRTLAHRITGSPRFGRSEPKSGGCATMLAPPGDRMEFFPVLHECCLQLSGWHILKLEGLEKDTVIDHHRRSHVDLAMVSLHDARLADDMTDCLRTLRGTSRNPRLRVVGFGAGFERSGAPARSFGLDAILHGPSETLDYLNAAVA